MDTQEATSHLEALLETGPYPLLTTHQENTIANANPPAHSLFGYHPPDLRECELDDLIPDLNDTSLNAIHTGQHSNGTTFPLTVHRSSTTLPRGTLLWLQDLRKITTPYDVNRPLQAALNHLAPIRDERGAHITQDSLPPATTYPPQLENIFTTLLTHAIEHAKGSSPRIHITSEQTPQGTQYALITNLPRPSSEQASPGLDACRRILKAHGGDLTLRPPDRSSLPPRTPSGDIPPGQGAMFLVTIPTVATSSQESSTRGGKEDFPRQRVSWRGQP